MPNRKALPARRNSETFEIEWGGMARVYFVTTGFYDDGTPGEVFITGGKSGEQVEAVARDGAILLSLALQHGAALDTIAGAITRDNQGVASTIVGAVIDQLKVVSDEKVNK